MVLYPNKLPESERVCFGICTDLLYGNLGIRSKIQKTIVMVLSHYRTQATDYPYKRTQTYAETKRYKNR